MNENQIIANYQQVLQDIRQAKNSFLFEGDVQTELLAVSKTHEAPAIYPLLNAGHIHFGENRVQEAQAKWPSLKKDFPSAKLHLIGPLQSNKTADAVALFDVIHTVDRSKIANALANEMQKQGRSLPCFIQVNTGEESQKAGIGVNELSDFIHYCQRECGLNIVGLMCIPPVQTASAPHFALLKKLALKHSLSQLSMGMSGDYETAAALGATYVRVGSAIFGARS